MPLPEGDALIEVHDLKKEIQLVIRCLKMNWSPEQISNKLRIRKKLYISHETIYKFVLRDKKKGGTLYKHLRIIPRLRRKRYNSHDSRGILRGKRHISIRPKCVEKRRVLGHWEGDTMIGTDLSLLLVNPCGKKIRISGYLEAKDPNRRSGDEGSD